MPAHPFSLTAAVLAPGADSAFGQLNDSPARPRGAPFHTPSKGQLRVVLQFPEA